MRTIASALLLLALLTHSLGVAEAAGAANAANGAGATPGSSDSVVTTIFVVRHAEKNVIFAGIDPPLSDTGARRAQSLAHALRDAGVTAIYSTHWRRNRETAAPLAAALRDTVRVVDQGNAVEFVRRVKAENQGGAALVVGHSDTIPQILAQITGQPEEPFAGDYDPLYILTVYAGGRTRLLKLRYGDPAPAPH